MRQSTKEKITKLIFVTDDVYRQSMLLAERSRDVIEAETLYLVNAFNALQDREVYVAKLKELACP